MCLRSCRYVVVPGLDSSKTHRPKTLRRESLGRAKWGGFRTELFGFWKCDRPVPVPTAQTLAA